MSATLYEQIRQFYDASTGLWEQVWGEHLHHGYYGADGTLKIDRRQAQIDLIEQFLKWGLPANFTMVNNAPNILDIGCGIGGSSLYLAEKFQAKVTGITLSPVQAKRATERAKDAGLENSVNFLVADALNTGFADDSFDLLWSLESAEHFPDKRKFLQEAYRILKPGGTLLMATWCHRPLDEKEGQLTDDERRHLAEIYRIYALPYVISLPEYEAFARRCDFINIDTIDWSKAVAPFWDIVIDSAFNPSVILGILMSGWQTIEGALSLGLMSRGYQRGLIRYGLLRAQKSARN
jgi:tocopherol O-methyltransferase